MDMRRIGQLNALLAVVGRQDRDLVARTAQVLDRRAPDQLVAPEMMRRVHVADGQHPHRRPAYADSHRFRTVPRAAPEATIVIRVKDEAAAMERTLGLLAAQTRAAATEIIVVDSGSTDGTLDVVERHGVDELVAIAPGAFTFGGALNAGAERARAEVVVALSAHSFPTDPLWLEHVLEAMADPRVAAASGPGVDFAGRPLRGRIVQDRALAEAHPYWGYSNHAGAFRRSLWTSLPFRTDMPASEDKAWAWHWLAEGYVVVLGADLAVEHRHGREPLRRQYRRAYFDWQSHGMFRDVEPEPLRAVVGRWWTDREGYPGHLRARLSPLRMARLAGGYAGRRAASTRS